MASLSKIKRLAILIIFILVIFCFGKLLDKIIRKGELKIIKIRLFILLRSSSDFLLHFGFDENIFYWSQCAIKFIWRPPWFKIINEILQDEVVTVKRMLHLWFDQLQIINRSWVHFAERFQSFAEWCQIISSQGWRNEVNNEEILQIYQRWVADSALGRSESHAVAPEQILLRQHKPAKS